VTGEVGEAVPAVASEQGPDSMADLRVLSGSPNASELAAIAAVLTGVLEELADERDRSQSAAASAWSRDQRPIRTPIHPGAGQWRGFSG
jgi:hypothetical protein